MYHEKTTAQVKRRKRQHVTVAVVVVAVAVLLAVLARTVHMRAREQGAVTMRDSIMTAAQQCCATEGAYPKSVEHLEKYYGLSINTDDYVLTYDAYASNIMPSVVVVPR